MSKFNIGDKIVLKDYDTLCKIRRVNNNDFFERHYNYIKSKEPLTITWVWDKGTISYGDEDDILERRGKETETTYYKVSTPRSDYYLFAEEEIDEYKENTETV